KKKKESNISTLSTIPRSHLPNQRLRSSLHTAPFSLSLSSPKISQRNISKVERKTAKNLNNSQKHLKVKIFSLSLSLIEESSPRSSELRSGSDPTASNPLKVFLVI
ncbi:hypothetical protein AKJ16_DCAP25745, partial [Drosera capensis]